MNQTGIVWNTLPYQGDDRCLQRMRLHARASLGKFLKSIGIVLLCIVAAVCYGIVHDQITARICVEYFTIGHPPVFGTADPTLLGLGWGILATWWVGLLLGVSLAFSARFGPRPKRDVGSLLRPVVILLGIMALCATVAGIVGTFAATSHFVYLVEPLATDVPANRHVAFLTDLWIHSASYGVGFVGGIVICWQVWRSRRTST
jgi:hypothetical protein